MRSLLILLLVPFAAIVSLAACSSVETEINKASGSATATSASSTSGTGGATSTSATVSSVTTAGVGGETTGLGGAGGAGGVGGVPDAYPAPHPSMPQMTKGPGVVLHDPVIVTVTWAGDPFESYVQTFDDTIGGTPWYAATTSEYGVNPAVGGGHVVLDDNVNPPPAMITDTQIQSWLAAKIADSTLPPPTDQTIYALYYPNGSTITLEGPGGGPSCSAFGGYHSNTTAIWNNVSLTIAYAVLPRCGSNQMGMTVTASHEFIEASTDPHPEGLYAWDLTSLSAWNPAGGEDADLCEFVGGTTEGMYAVTRGWSNAAAKIGQQPCVPVPADPQNIPYFNAGVVTDILKVHPGGSATTDIDCYSFGPLPNPITLTTQANSKQVLTLTFDKDTCVNGDVVKMTATLTAAATKGTDYHYQLLSTLDMTHQHLWRG